MIFDSFAKKSLFALLTFFFCLDVSADSWLLSGHTKYQFLYNTFPDESLFRDFAGANTDDHSLDIRFMTGHRKNHFDFNADYQLITLYGESLASFNSFSFLPITPAAVINDDRRLLDLTHTLNDGDRHAIIHRLDRLNMGYTRENIVLRIGRQAVSWGNGLMYSVMDIFNPFDPTAIDKEYKTGDDMLYSQYLQGNGHDWQLIYVARRDINSGHIESGSASQALKYHGFISTNEYDLLLAQHYEDNVIGLGGSGNLADAVWRADVTINFLDDNTAEDDTVTSLASSISYSWIAWNTNFSGHLEYFYNGFGLREEEYDQLLNKLPLLQRLQRGELFTISKHYLALSSTVELTPLLLLTPNLFVNLKDHSSMLQLVMQYNWLQNLQLTGALNIPSGSDDTEYGGIETHIDDKLLSTGPGLFLQLGWYY